MVQAGSHLADSENNMAFFNERLMVTVLRWTARTIGVALLGPVALIAIDLKEGVPNPFTLSLQDNLLGVALLTMTFGLLVGWKREGIGGLSVLGGVGLFAVMNYGYGDWPNVLTVAWLVTGLLYLICWWRTSRRSVGEDSDQMEAGAGTRIVARFWIPLVLVLAHATLVALIGTDIALSHDPEAGMVWRMFVFIDYPTSLCIDLLPPFFSSNESIVLTILVVGTIQWGTVGLVLQQVVRWLHR
jgi:hypothetical protein